MDAGFAHILYAVEEGVARLTFDRPAVLNAMSIALRQEVWTALDLVDADDTVRALVFRGAGERAFSSGADISEFGTAPSLDAARRARIEQDLWGRLLATEKPLVAALHGYVLGAGLELALCCDFRIAASDAQLGLPEGRLGYLPSAGGTQTLSRLAGPGAALDIIFTGEPVDAATALELGIVDTVVAPEELDAAAGALAQRLASMPVPALRLAKRAVREGLDLTLQQGLTLEAHLRAVLHA